MKRIPRTLLAVAIMGAIAGVIWQSRSKKVGAEPAQPRPASPPLAQRSGPAEQKINPIRFVRADRIFTTVNGVPEWSIVEKTSERRVDLEGNIRLPLVDQVRVGGLTIGEAEAAIEDAYRRHFQRDFQVTIKVTEYAPRPISIMGDVKHPGLYSFPPEFVMTVNDMVIQAGGFTDAANVSAVRLSRPDHTGTQKVIKLDLASPMNNKSNGKTPDGAFVLAPNDTVFVPEKLF